jgi:hypothetical protein
MVLGGAIIGTYPIYAVRVEISVLVNTMCATLLARLCAWLQRQSHLPYGVLTQRLAPCKSAMHALRMRVERTFA